MKPFLSLLLLTALLAFSAKADTMGAPATDADGRHDFDFYIGSWTIENHVLQPGGAWKAFESTTTDRAFLAGMGNIDEMTLPRDAHGASLRFFDPQTKLWSIYWATSTRGKLELPPEVGKFEDGVGHFYGDDVDAAGKPVKVRFTWTRASADHLHWDQAYSYDGGKTWQVNWTMEFTRR